MGTPPCSPLYTQPAGWVEAADHPISNQRWTSTRSGKMPTRHPHPEASQGRVREAAIAQSSGRILAVLSDVWSSAAQFTAFEPFRKIAFSIDSCASTIDEFTLCAYKHQVVDTLAWRRRP